MVLKMQVRPGGVERAGGKRGRQKEREKKQQRKGRVDNLS